MDRKITHIIFDMDGLLLDTEPIYTEVTEIIVRQYGKHFDMETKSKMLGRESQEAARILTESLNLPITPQEYLEAQRAMFTEKFPLAQPMPGAKSLTMNLKKENIPMAVATSSCDRNYRMKTVRHQEWFNIFETIVNGDDEAVKNCKPSPDLFLIAAERMNAKPEHCLVFEDAPTGILAARAAGMSVIAIPDPSMDPTPYQEADQILKSLLEFKPTEWNLPDIPIL